MILIEHFGEWESKAKILDMGEVILKFKLICNLTPIEKLVE